MSIQFIHLKETDYHFELIINMQRVITITKEGESAIIYFADKEENISLEEYEYILKILNKDKEA